MQSETTSDSLDPARARAMQVILGQAPRIEAGSPLPPFFHQLYFWSPEPAENLGRDGHPKTGLKGSVIPDPGLPRRMWAGGQLRFERPLLAGHPAQKVTRLETMTEKQGRSGPLTFVTLRHEISQGGELCLTEMQDIVYRGDPDPDMPRPTVPDAPTNEDVSRPLTFDTTVLFRYSALTFNGHRIHYDLDYARDVEGYAGLVTHGPLLAQQLMLLAEAEIGTLKTFRFRATAPLMHFEVAEACYRSDGTLWVRGPDGRLCMIAEAT